MFRLVLHDRTHCTNQNQNQDGEQATAATAAATSNCFATIRADLGICADLLLALFTGPQRHLHYSLSALLEGCSLAKAGIYLLTKVLSLVTKANVNCGNELRPRGFCSCKCLNVGELT
jgi:hypothetical protein